MKRVPSLTRLSDGCKMQCYPNLVARQNLLVDPLSSATTPATKHVVSYLAGMRAIYGMKGRASHRNCLGSCLDRLHVLFSPLTFCLLNRGASAQPPIHQLQTYHTADPSLSIHIPRLAFMGFFSRFCLIAIYALCASAHFILRYPKSLGFNDDTESTSPCGGFDVTFNSSDDSVPVGGFPVSMLSTHPAANWLFRATLDQKAPFNWTNLLPVVEETGLGQFCLPAIKAPSDFTGKPGVIQVIQQGPDGILYQVSFFRGLSMLASHGCGDG